MSRNEKETFVEKENDPVAFSQTHFKEDVGQTLGVLIQFVVRDLCLPSTFPEKRDSGLFPPVQKGILKTIAKTLTDHGLIIPKKDLAQ
jgi:hypothetical protein